jgi:hypothetical protein
MEPRKPKKPAAINKPVEAEVPQVAEPQAAPAPQARQRVSIDAEVWQAIDQLLANLPYKTTAPIITAVQRTGGAVVIEG